MKNNKDKLKLLKAEKNLLAAGAIAASVGVTATIPSVVCNAAGMHPFENYSQCYEYITTTTHIDNLHGESNRKENVVYYNQIAAKFNTIPENKINAAVHSVKIDSSDNMLGVIDNYSIPYTDENRKLANTFSTYDEIEPLLSSEVDSSTYDFGLDFSDYANGNEDVRKLFDEPFDVYIESSYLSDEVVDVEKDTARIFYEIVIFGELFLGSDVVSYLLFNSLKKALSKKIDSKIQSLEGTQKLVLK